MGGRAGRLSRKEKERRPAVPYILNRVLDRRFAAQTHLSTQVDFSAKRSTYSTLFLSRRTIHQTNSTTGTVTSAVSIPLLNPVV